MTGFGGAHKQGALYEINLATNKLTVLSAFTGGGIQPYRLPSLVLRGGRLYGTTNSGGATNACNNQGCGTVFELTP